MAKALIGLDVGEKRIGVAIADTGVRIAVAYDTLLVDGSEGEAIRKLIIAQNAQTLVIGYPRNQSGEATAQTAYVEAFAQQFQGEVPELVFQDESLTSVLAEQHLQQTGKPYAKGDIDAQAAALILQDYLELHP